MTKEDYSDEESSKKLLYALDIGSTKLRLVAGVLVGKNNVEIHGLMECPSLGISEGYISDIDLLSDQIASLIQEFQNTYGQTIKDFIVGISGCYILSANSRGITYIHTGIIKESDRNRVIKNALINNDYINRKDYYPLHIFPQYYQTESSAIVTNPIGMYARELKADIHLICGSDIYKKNIQLAINKVSSDISVTSLFYTGYASSASVLKREEIDMGVVHLDIGAKTVNVTVYQHHPILSFYLSNGGSSITQQIANSFGIPFYIAEIFKCDCGLADPKLFPNNIYETTVLECLQKNQYDELTYENANIKMSDLSKVINKALLDLFDNILISIKKKLTSQTANQDLCAGIVVTGGSAKLHGIESAVKAWLLKKSSENNSIIIAPKIRIGIPLLIKNKDYFLHRDFVFSPDKSVVIGLLEVSTYEQQKQDKKNKQNFWTITMCYFKNIIFCILTIFK